MSQPAGLSVTRHPGPVAAPLLPDSACVLSAVLDALAILLASALANLLYWALTGSLIAPGLCLFVSLLLASFFALLMRSWALYDTRNLLLIERQIKWASIAWFASIGFVLGIAFLLKISADISRGVVVLLAGVGLFTLTLQRVCWPFVFGRALERGIIHRRRALVLSLLPWSESGLQMRLLR